MSFSNKSIWIGVISIIVIIISAFIKEKNIYKESFMPKKVKEFYRPFERNVRTGVEGFYNYTRNQSSRLFRYFGII
jgi:hypothetical protein